VTVCFTRVGERADDRIVRWVSARPEAVVVSSDGAVRQAARRRGAAVLDAESFAARVDAALAEPAGAPARSAFAPRPAPRGRQASRQAAWLRGL